MHDESNDPMFAPAVVQPAVDFLASLAGDGPALEFGVGTGRIALPLSARGARVHGIDLDEASIARLRAKPGGDAIGVTIGDFARVQVDGRFRLVYLVFNTIMNLVTQDAQVACFENAAHHLQRGGCFVIETMIPALRRLPSGERFVVFDGSPSHWGVDEYDVANQQLVSHHFDMDGDRARKSSGLFRYALPGEFDLMARLAGLELRERWAGWGREPFTSESTSHVSVWQKR